MMLPAAATLAGLAFVASGCGDPTAAVDGPTPTPTQAAVESPVTRASVTGIVDGTTIEIIADGQVFTIGYLGIELPEAGPGDPLDAALAEEAAAFNRFLVGGKIVELERGAVDTDAFGRILRYVYVDGEMVNLTMLTNGYAAVAGFPLDFARRTDFMIAEENARAGQRGAWRPDVLPNDVGTPSPVATATALGSRLGTLPLPPTGGSNAGLCEYSGSEAPAIKGNIEARTGDRVYHVPGGLFYTTTEIDESQGDRWFCTEADALAAGWKKSKR